MARTASRIAPIAESKRVLLYLPEALYDQCRSRAEASHRSVNGQILWLLETGLLVDEPRGIHRDPPPGAARAE